MHPRSALLVVILSAASLGTCFSPALGAAEDPVNKEPIVLPPFQVKEDVRDSFGIGIAFVGEKKTMKVTQAVISSVVPGSDAERSGLKVGDEIVSIDGRKITDFPLNTRRGSELFKVLVDRPNGTKLKLGIVVRTVQTITLTAVPTISFGAP